MEEDTSTGIRAWDSGAGRSKSRPGPVLCPRSLPRLPQHSSARYQGPRLRYRIAPSATEPNYQPPHLYYTTLADSVKATGRSRIEERSRLSSAENELPILFKSSQPTTPPGKRALAYLTKESITIWSEQKQKHSTRSQKGVCRIHIMARALPPWPFTLFGIIEPLLL